MVEGSGAECEGRRLEGMRVIDRGVGCRVSRGAGCIRALGRCPGFGIQARAERFVLVVEGDLMIQGPGIAAQNLNERGL